MTSTTRRHFLRTCSAAAGAGLLQACGTGTTTTPQTKTTSTTAKAKTVQPKQPHPPRSGDNLLRVVAPSGFAEDPNRVTTGLTRLYNAGFTVTNQQAGSRRYQRFAGSDAQRAADFQDVASGRVETPKVLMGLRAATARHASCRKSTLPHSAPEYANAVHCSSVSATCAPSNSPCWPKAI